ncbi:MAG: hypothetical protein AB7P04_06785 [Bacteriovoracia bacterium]
METTLTSDRRGPETSRPRAGVVPFRAPGIAPPLLIQQIQSTAPFVLTWPMGPARQVGPLDKDSRGALEYVEIIQRTAQRTAASAAPEAPVFPDNPADYFALCVAAHWATVGSFVPTDVDNAIRFKLWDPALPVATLNQMAETVLRARTWDERPFTRRWVPVDSTERLSGHHGEWFSVAAGAYGALRRKDPEHAQTVADAIIEEVNRHARVTEKVFAERDGKRALLASVLVAHNLGDLDRVIEMWNLPEGDPLRTAVHKAGHEAKPGLEILERAGALNKKTMAVENHRHFALRHPRFLRAQPEFLLDLCPFLDDWGTRLVKHPGVTPEQIAELVGALIDGWKKLHGTVAYARALAGITQAFPGGMSNLERYLPSRVAKELKSGSLRVLIDVPRARFEEQWADKAGLPKNR